MVENFLITLTAMAAKAKPRFLGQKTCGSAEHPTQICGTFREHRGECPLLLAEERGQGMGTKPQQQLQVELCWHDRFHQQIPGALKFC